MSADCLEMTDVNLARMTIFSHKTRYEERIPLTRNALDLHVKRSVCHASISACANMSMIPDENPTGHGLKNIDNKLPPIWTTHPLRKDMFQNQVKCSC